MWYEVEAKKNPTYLRGLADDVQAFLEAFKHYVSLHETNGDVARGIVPAVFPLPDVPVETIEAAAEAASLAAGRASAAPALTNCLLNVQGLGVIDPVAAWHTISKPKPVLEPDDIVASCNSMLGRLEGMVRKAEAEAPPQVGVRELHPLVWGACSRLWGDSHHREAVAAAAEAVIGQVKSRTGRNDVSETALWQETFSDKPPGPGRPRLRWPGDHSDRSVRTMNDGLRQFAPGVQMTIRNPAAHHGPISEQQALERLAALSLLAHWVDGCELISSSDDVPV